MSRKWYVQCYQLSSCPTVQEYHKKSTNTKYELTPELASLLRNALPLHGRKTFLSSRFQIISLQNQAVGARKSRKGTGEGHSECPLTVFHKTATLPPSFKRSATVWLDFFHFHNNHDPRILFCQPYPRKINLSREETSTNKFLLKTSLDWMA